MKHRRNGLDCATPVNLQLDIAGADLERLTKLWPRRLQDGLIQAWQAHPVDLPAQQACLRMHPRELFHVTGQQLPAKKSVIADSWYSSGAGKIQLHGVVWDL